MKRSIFLWWIFFFPISGFALQPVLLTDSVEKCTLGIIEILEDQTKSLSFEDVLNKSSSFYVPGKELLTQYDKYIYRYRDKASYWIRFTVLDQSSVNRFWLLQYMDPNIDKISVYIPEGNGIYKEYESGSVFSFFHRPLLHKNFEFHMPFSKGKPSVIYMRIDPGNSRVFVAELNTYENFVAHSLEEYLLLGLFYGFILMIGVYNFGLYISIGEKQYLYYLFYTVSVCLFFMYHDGLGFQFIWPHNPAWRDKVLTYSLFGIIIWTIFYSKWFLDYKNRMPLINTILVIILMVISVILLTTFIFPRAYEYFLIPVAAASYLLIYISGFRIYIQGYKPAGYFLLAYTFLFLGFIIRLLTFFNYFLETMFTVYSYNAGILIEMTLFSIAIGYRIKTIKQEREAALIEKDFAHRETIKHLKEKEILKDKVNKELEGKVAQRTEELKNKNIELETANLKLRELTDKANQWNIRLDLDNRSLQQNMKDLNKARVVMKEVTFSEFSEVFPDNDACYKYLAELKWKDGYKCRRCSNVNFGKGKSVHSRRCTKCHYQESPTSGTLFHHLKFPITKAFYMCYLVSIRDVTSDELSELLSLRRETCWSFRKKIMEAKKSKKIHKNESTDEWGLLALISLTDHYK